MRPMTNDRGASAGVARLTSVLRASPSVWVAALAAVAIITVVAVLAPAAAVVGVFAAAFLVAAVLTILNPAWALVIFTIGLPLHALLMAVLYDVSGSHLLVKLAQPWKEAILAIALVRALLPITIRFLRAARTRQVRLSRLSGLSGWSRLDLLIGAFALLCLVSVALPSTTVSLGGRVLGARDLLVPFAAYAVGRVVPLSERVLRVWLNALASVVGIFSLGAIGERLFWGHGLFLAVNAGQYFAEFFGQHFPFPGNVSFTFYADGFLPRAGSLSLGPLDISLLLMVALPIVLAVLPEARARWSRAEVALIASSCGLGGIALLLAWGRASIVLVALGVAALLVVQGLRRQWRGASLVLAGALVGLLLMTITAAQVASVASIPARLAIADHGLVPSALGAHFPPEMPDTPAATSKQSTSSTSPSASSPSTPVPGATPPSATATPTPAGGAGGVFQQSLSANNSSTQSHLKSLRMLLRLMTERPFGYSVGAAGQVGVRSGTNIGGESAYFTVGVDLGVLGLLLYAAIFLGAFMVCYRGWRKRGHTAMSQPKSQATSGGLLPSLLLGAAVAWGGVLVNGGISEVTLDPFVMYVLWWLAGVAVAYGLRGTRKDTTSASKDNRLRAADTDVEPSRVAPAAGWRR